MSIAEILSLKFPNAKFTSDIILQDDGNGPYIKEWNLAGIKKPSLKDLSDWARDENIQAALEQKQKDEANRPLIQKLEELDLKSIRALRNNDENILNDLEAQAIVLRAQLV